MQTITVVRMRVRRGVRKTPGDGEEEKKKKGIDVVANGSGSERGIMMKAAMRMRIKRAVRKGSSTGEETWDIVGLVVVVVLVRVDRVVWGGSSCWGDLCVAGRLEGFVHGPGGRTIVPLR